MPQFEVLPHSPAAQALANAPAKTRPEPLPWKTTSPGFSFALPLDTANVRSLRATASKLRAEGVNYRVIVHKEFNKVEMARFPDSRAAFVAPQPAFTGPAVGPGDEVL